MPNVVTKETADKGPLWRWVRWAHAACLLAALFVLLWRMWAFADAGRGWRAVRDALDGSHTLDLLVCLWGMLGLALSNATDDARQRRKLRLFAVPTLAYAALRWGLVWGRP